MSRVGRPARAMGRHGQIQPIVTGCLALAAMCLVGCGSAAPATTAAGSSSLASPSPTPPPSPTPSPSQRPSPSPPPFCPNAGGGSCLGRLEAGTYTTTEWKYRLTYTVPSGWGNYEDLPGNFLLVPPGGSLGGVDAGTSDYVGVYASVVPAAPCDGPAQGLMDAAAMAAYLTREPELSTTSPRAITVGGLSGLVLDIRLAKSWKKSCFPTGGPSAFLITGLPPSEFDHGIGGDLAIRLYLLDGAASVVGIEVDDLSGGAHLDQYAPIIEGFRFGS